MKAQRAKTVNNAKAAVRISGKAIGGVLSVILKTAGTLLLITLITGLIFSCFFANYVKTAFDDELNVDLASYAQPQTSVIYYYDDDLQMWRESERLYSEENVVPVTLEEIPLNLRNAAVAIEDKRFYSHHGVDWYRTAGAFAKMFFMQDTFGGSTITQQLIKNITGDKEATVKRKLTEIFRALNFEARYSKEEILEAYLNVIPLGESCEGVGAAARVYFGKDVWDLSLAECASLIGITNNPSLYDPYISEASRTRNKTRQEIILSEMYKQEMITKEDRDAAIAETLVFRRVEVRRDENGEVNAKKASSYSWFTDAVIEDVIKAIMDKEQVTREIASKYLFTRGYSIYTTIDPKIQAMVDEVYTNPENYPEGTSKTQSLNSAVIISDPYTGDIVAMAGGLGEKEGKRTYNYATDMKRPPGSSIKPISVYAPALDLGLIQTWHLVNDSEIGVLSGRSDGWWPKNSNRTNKGLVTIRDAVQESINTVSAQILDRLTPQVSFMFLEDKLHITSLVRSENGLTDIDYAPLALGQLTNGISVREEAAAYSIFPNRGIYTESRTFSAIYDSAGKLYIDNQSEQNVAISEYTAYQMTEMMKRVLVSPGTGVSANMKGVTGIPLAGKTGTSGGSSDRWFAGFTPYYVGVVWVGYENPENISTSVSPANALFSKVMSKIHETLEAKNFTEPENLKEVTICAESGKLATSACEDYMLGNHTITLKMRASEVPQEKCDAHVYYDFCQLQTDTAAPSGKVYKAGTITGLHTQYCPLDSLVRISVLDVSKCTAYNVPLPESDMPYTTDRLYNCYVHTR
ncbi:MAG: transglycosylase domain-containing protein, partial [Oscillospiraceae bacterium]|nr:transglycosylase domain-containing protein [Oscillospiraceae bacterium]